MTDPAAPSAAPSAPVPDGEHDGAEGGAVWLLACGQMLGYACFFYLFAALILYWQRETGWATGLLSAGMTLAVVLSALVAPLAGRAVDRGWAVLLLTGGAGLGALSLILLALAPAPWAYLLAWSGLGLAQGLCLYEPCFALMIRHFGSQARGAITKVTLVGGFASTLAFPAASLLAERWGWRGAVWGAALVAGGAVLPLNLIGARRLIRAAAPAPMQAKGAGPDWRATLLRPAFLRLSAVFSLIALDHWMLLAFLRPILAEARVDTTLAVTAAALIGPAQVGGRLILLASGARVGTRAVLFITVASYAVAPLCLALAGASAGLVLGFALLQGAANGVMTILRPLLVAEVVGQGRFGALAGLLAVPMLMASAAAPLLGAGLMALGGGGLIIATALTFALLALVLAARPSR